MQLCISGHSREGRVTFPEKAAERTAKSFFVVNAEETLRHGCICENISACFAKFPVIDHADGAVYWRMQVPKTTVCVRVEHPAAPAPFSSVKVQIPEKGAAQDP